MKRYFDKNNNKNENNNQWMQSCKYLENQSFFNLSNIFATAVLAMLFNGSTSIQYIEKYVSLITFFCFVFSLRKKNKRKNQNVNLLTH